MVIWWRLVSAAGEGVIARRPVLLCEVPMKKNTPGRPRVVEITDPQRRTLTAISRHVARFGYPPTLIELADTLGITHPSAHDQVNQLVRKGYLRREPNKARGLTVVQEPPLDTDELVPVPIIGRIAAGLPILAEENIEGEVLVDARTATRGRCFALHIVGDSMTGADIRDGDLVIVRQQPVAENGDIVAALLGDEATVKRLSIREEVIELRPENARYKPIPVRPEDEMRIIGKVVAVRKVGKEKKTGIE